jgi:hypothetical protein
MACPTGLDSRRVPGGSAKLTRSRQFPETEPTPYMAVLSGVATGAGSIGIFVPLPAIFSHPANPLS